MVARRVARVAAQALVADVPAHAVHRVTQALAEAVGADDASYHEFHEQGWGVLHATAPAAAAWEVLPLRGAQLEHLPRLHPGVSLVHSGWVCAPLAPAGGTTVRMQIGVDSPSGVARGWSLTRRGTGYSRGDLEVADALRPVLEAVVARWTTAVEHRLGGGEPLTERELVVLRCLADGSTAAAAARRLAISPRTVHKHLERIHAKLGVSDRVSAINVARRLGLIAEPGIPQQQRRGAGP